MQTGDKHVSVTQDGINYGFGGYKTKFVTQSGENQKR
jgi:hypothetical protein